MSYSDELTGAHATKNGVVDKTMKKPKPNKRTMKTERHSSSELAPASWVDALAETWERRIDGLEPDARSSDYAISRAASNVINALKRNIEELRAGAESASTEKLNHI